MNTFRFITLFFTLALMFSMGCDVRGREESLTKREAALNEKEQELLLKEKTLQLREDDIAKQQRLLDSSMIADTTAVVNPDLIGSWAVTMKCIETNCQGSAVGDVKTETWDLSYEANNVMAKAKVNDELVRVYSGVLTGDHLELTEAASPSTSPTTKIVVRLQFTSASLLEGQREIERQSESCKTIYSMEMKKK